MLKVMGDCGYGHRHTFTVITEGDEQFFSAVVHDVCLSPSTFLCHGESDSIFPPAPFLGFTNHLILERQGMRKIDARARIDLLFSVT